MACGGIDAPVLYHVHLSQKGTYGELMENWKGRNKENEKNN